MMNYTTRQPAHSWEDTLPLLPHSSAPFPSSLALPSPCSLSCSFLTPFSPSPLNNLILSRSFLHLRCFTRSSPLLPLLARPPPLWLTRHSGQQQGLPERCCSQVSGVQVIWLRHPSSPSSACARTTAPPLICSLSLSGGVTCRAGCDWAHYLP